jgi:hypothetical protein
MRPLVGSTARLRVAARALARSPRMDLEDAAYGPQLDPVPAAVSIFILCGATLMRLKIDGAIAARVRSDEAALAVKQARVAMISGNYDGDLDSLESEASALAAAAEEARTISIIGLSLRFMVPLPLGSPAPSSSSPSSAPRAPQRGEPLDDASSGATMRRASLAFVLGLVVLAQASLLALFSMDPMGGGAPPFE